MNRKIIVLGLAVCLLGVFLYSYYYVIKTSGYIANESKEHRVLIDVTIYPYRNNSLIIAVFGVVTFLSGLAIPKRRD